MKTTIKCGKGVNKDALPAELELGYWSDANNFRFRNGVDEKVGGIAEIMATPSITSYGLFTYQTTTKRFVLEVGTAKIYCHDGTTRTEITPYKRNVPTYTVADDGTVTGAQRLFVTTVAHGLSGSETVIVSGATGTNAAMWNTSSAGDVINSVPTASQFYYDASSSSTPSPATYSGTGAIIYTVISGASVDMSGTADTKVTGGHLSGVFILNHPSEGLFYWAGDTSVKMKQLPLLTYVADVGRPFGNWFVQLAPTMSGTKYPRRVLWSAAAEPGALPTSFDSAATNDAGNVELDDTNGFLIDCLPWAEVNHIYKDDGRYTMRWIGGNDVFDFRPVGDPVSLLAVNCVTNTDVGQVFVTKSLDVRIHQGGISKSIAEGRIRQYLQGDIDSTYGTRAFCSTNHYTKEVWFFYPRTNSTTCNGAVFWNWEMDTWGISHRSLNVTAATNGLLPTTIAKEQRMIIGTSSPKLGLFESGTTDLGGTITATLERTGIHFDKRSTKKTLHTSRMDVDATAANTASVYHGSASMPDTAPSYSSAVTMTQGTTRNIDAFADSAEYVAWKMSTTATDWKHRAIELDVIEDGEF